MSPRTQELISFFKSHGGVLRFTDILKAGFHPDSLISLEKEKEVEKIARGLYRLTHYTFVSHPDLIAVAFQAPRGVICLISALAFHESTSEIPKQVDLAIPESILPRVKL